MEAKIGPVSGNGSTQRPKFPELNQRTGTKKEQSLKCGRYSSQADAIQTGKKTCLPPLTLRRAHGKYEATRRMAQGGEGEASPTGPIGIGAGSDRRRNDAAPPAPAKNSTQTGADDTYRFPVAFWDGPLFKAYKNCPKLRGSMTLRRLKALKSLLSLRDFETKTGLSEAECYLSEKPSNKATLTTTRRRDSLRSQSKMSSEHAHRKSISVHRLPTIAGE